MVSHVVKHILTVYIVGFDVETAPEAAKLRVLELPFFYSPDSGGRQIRKVSSRKISRYFTKTKTPYMKLLHLIFRGSSYSACLIQLWLIIFGS